MTDPSPDADLERRIGALWEHNRHQDGKIRDLQTWQARQEATSEWRRWVLPVALSIPGVVLTVAHLLHH